MKRFISIFVMLCMLLSTFAIIPAGAATTDIADTAAEVEVADTGAGIFGLVDNVQDGQILQCWNWSYRNIAENMSLIAQQGFSAIQTSPIQASKESTRESWSTVMNSSWVYYQPISFTIETNSYSALGTKDDFVYMCETAHKYGVKVIVDVVLNHMANDMTENTIHPYIPSDIRDNSDCWHDVSKNIYNYENRYDVTHYCLSGLPDLNTANSTVQWHCTNILKEAIEAGADGFRIDAAKHIETDWDADGTKSDFWSNVLGDATAFAQETRGITPYYYGEILGTPGGGLSIEAYTQYMSVTDTGANDIRYAVCSGNASGAAKSGISCGAAPSKTVQWTESHDTYKDNNTRDISDHNINKTWAIVGARDEVCGMYLARPEDINTTMLGDADLTSWTYPEVKAVNNFKNYFVGKSEYLSSYNSLACVERGTSGMVIVNTGGTYYNGMSAPVHTMASGTYTDAITGNTFTVSDGYISGDIGDTGIAVVYNVEDSGVFTKGNVTDVCIAGTFNDWNTSADRMIAIDGNTVSTTMFLDSGTYTFKVATTTGIWYGNAGTIEDTTTTTSSSGWSMSSAEDENCTLNASGGRYTFTFNVSTGKLIVEHDSTTDKTSDFYLKGTFNNWDSSTPLKYTSGDNIVSATISLAAGTYTFKINNPAISVWYSNKGTIDNVTNSSGWTMTPGIDNNCTLNAAGGNYTFAFNLSTQKLVITTDAVTEPTTAETTTEATETTVEDTTETTTSGSSDSTGIYLKGSFNGWTDANELAATEDSNVITTTLSLEAGTYTFKLHDAGASVWYGNGGTIQDTTTTTSSSGWTMASSEGNCTLNASGGTYTFNFNTSTKKLIILYTAAETDPTETSYTVTFKNWDGTVLSTQKVTEGSSAEAPSDPVRAADAQYTYTFAGWDTDFSSITADTTVTATYTQTVNKYTVTFKNYDGTVLDAQTVEYGKSATAPEAPVREADAQYTYSFAGWDTDFSSVKSDITVTAIYTQTVNKYTVTFKDYDGTVLSTQSVEYGKSATAPADPTREGYEFLGWDTSFDSITGDTTVTAVYSDDTVYLRGSFNDWELTTPMSISDSDSNIVTVTVTLEEGSYTFKMYHQETWYGNNGTIQDTTTATSSKGWLMETGKGNCTLTASGGTYTFNYNKSTHYLEILYKAPEYTVTFKDYDGTVLSTQTVAKGAAAEAPADPTRAADAQYTYTFAGWDTDFSSVKADTTVTATYTSTVNKYTVTFKDYDGDVLDAQSVEYGKSATAPAEPSREATAQYTYTFAGWDTDFSSVKSDTIVTATYTQTTNKYTVTFKNWDGTVLSTQSVEYGKSATAPADPAREGYIFSGWDKTFANITGDLIVTATYTEASEVTFTVTFVDYDGTVLKTETVPYGSDATPPLEPLRASTTSGSSFLQSTTYYIFDSWDGEYTNVTADTTVTATYTSVTSNFMNRVYYYFVYFKDYDGTILKQQNVKSGTTVTPPADPTREGYTFAGWDNTDFTIAAETTYTATYTENVVESETYTVTFVDYNGRVIDTQTVKKGSSAIAPDSPSRESDAQYTYTFSGWDGNYSNITEDTTVTATYTQTVNKYTVTFKDYDGTVLDTQSVEYGKSATAPAEPSREATAQYTYTFSGWDGNYSNITEDTTVTATYTQTVNKYTVTFKDYDGTVLDTQSVEYGKSATAPAEPSREATAQYTYTFAGWDTDFSSVTADITVTATYTETVNKYTVTFVDMNGNIIDTQTVAYGSAATAPTAPAVEGYTFKSWDADFSNVTADITVTAQYEKNSTVPTVSTGKLKIDVTGGTGFTISFNGGVARPQGPSYNNSKAPVGAAVTVTAMASGNSFVGWVNTSDGKVLSTDLSYSFYTSGNDHIRAMFTVAIEGVQMVSFYDDKNNQYVDSQYYASTDAITFPEFTMAPGYDFIKWNMTEAEIQAEIAAGNDVVVKPVWERQLVYVTITVNGGTISGTEKDGKYLANSGTTVRANTAPAGQKFAYWADGDGNIKSYDTEYVFYPKTDMVLTAVFVGENDMIDYQVLVSVNSFVVADPYGQVNVSWYVPAEEMGVEYVAGGLIAVNANDYNEATFVHGTSDTKVFDKTGNSATKPVSSYTWTGPFTDGTIFYVKAWVQYKDASGTVQTVYSDIYTVDRVND